MGTRVTCFIPYSGPVESLIVALGDPFSLVCTDEAGRDLEWFLNGTPVMAFGEYFIKHAAGRSELGVLASGLQNAGYYTCQPRDDAHVLYRAAVTVDDRSGEHDDVIRWKRCPHYCPLVRVIHHSPVDSLTEDQ